jgi:uncharacterized membrane protein
MPLLLLTQYCDCSFTIKKVTIRAMDSYTQSTNYTNTSIAEKTNTTNSAVVARPSLTTRAFYQAQRAVTPWISWLRQVFNFSDQSSHKARSFLVNLGLILVAAIAAKILWAIVDTLEEIPLMRPLLQLIGIGYSIWFVNRYLLKTATRQELVQKLQSLRDQVLGRTTPANALTKPIPPRPASTVGQELGQTLTNLGEQIAEQVETTSGVLAESTASSDISAVGKGVKKSVVIHQSPEGLYRFWRNFENLPRFIRQLDSIEILDDRRARWLANAPSGIHVAWHTEIIDEKEPNIIVWRSIERDTIDSVGSVAFTSVDDNSTEVKMTLQYKPESIVGAAVSAIFGEDPEQRIEADLRQLKSLMESSTGVAV